MERKRVRVYKPTNSYQQGGGIPMDDQGGSAQQILIAFIQAQQMTEQEAQQFMQQFAQMQPQEQQQLLSQITQQLSASSDGSGMTMGTPEPQEFAKFGGDMKKLKKGYYKKIGGVSADPNVTKDNVVEGRAAAIMNAIGSNWARNEVDRAYQQQMQNIANMPTFDWGGSYNQYMPFYGGMDTNYINDNYYSSQNDMMSSAQNLGDAFKNILGSATPSGVKIRTRGEMFKRPFPASSSNSSPNSSSDFSTEDKNRMASELFGLKDGGGIPKFQKGSSYSPDALHAAFDDLDIKDEDYAAAYTAKNDGTATPEQIALMNKVEDYVDKYVNSTASGGNEFYTGPMGGFYIKDGKLQYMAPQGMNLGNAVNMLGALPMGNYAGDFISAFGGPGAIGQAFQAMTPEDVYMTKFRAKSGLFGPRVVAKWDYKENGKPVQKEVIEEEQDPNDPNAKYRNYGKFDESRDARKAKRLQRRGDRAYDRFMGDRTQDVDNVEDVKVNMPQPPLSPEQKAYMQESLNPEYLVPYNTSGPVNDEFAYGGIPKARAGKLVMKTKWNTGIAPWAQNFTNFEDMASSILEANQNRENEAAYAPTSWGAVLKDGTPMGRGSWGVGPGLIGQEVPWMQPGYEQAYRFPQDMSGMAEQYPAFYGKQGGTYQDGGMYDYEDDSDVEYLDDWEIQEIINNGGTVQYLND